ncbi:MAG: acetoin dehydrogenase dihydrolipoyllysine-residue acetyltransferase subunit [Geminicoccaceae bacterium]
MSGEIQPIVMPKWGLAMQEGMVAAWHVEAGTELKSGQEICDIETSKIANIFESPVAGPLRRVVAQPGETLPVGALIAVVADSSVDDAAIDAFVEDFQANFVVEDAGDSGPEPETVDTPAGRVRYLKVGEGDAVPVLFVHGFGGDLNNWMFNQEALAEDRATYAIDLPGHGGSTKHVGEGKLAVLSEAVLAFMGALSIEKAHLVGHSMGGAVALEVASKAPDKAASVTLLAPAGLGPDVNKEFINGFISQNRAKKLKPVLQHLVHDPNAITDEMVEEVIKFKRIDGAVMALERLRDGFLFNEPNVSEAHQRLSALNCPVQVIWGQDDRILAAGHVQGLPHGIKVVHFEHTGHMPHMERAAEVNELIKAQFS